MNYEEQYNKFLKKEIEKYCNKDKKYEMFWDYRDSLSPQDLYDAYRNKQSNFSLEETLLDKLLDLNYDYEYHFFDQIEEDLRQQSFYDDEFENWYWSNALVRDISPHNVLYEIGYGGIDVNLKDLLKNSTFNMNICFATPREKNYGLEPLVNVFGSYNDPSIDEDSISDFDNVLTYVVHQQGHTMQEYYNCLIENPSGFDSNHDCSFIESLVDENVNNSSDLSQFVVLLKMNGNEAVEFLDNLNNSNEPFLKFDKAVDCGVVNTPEGAGGLLEVKLEKDLVIAKDLVEDIQIEGANNRNYSINEIYDLVNSCWKEDCVSYTNEEPILVDEDYKELINNLKHETESEMEM